MSDLDPAVDAFIAWQSALDDLERLASELPDGMIRADLRVLLPLWESCRYGYDPADPRHPPRALDRASIMSLVERLASLLVDDAGARWAITDVVDLYRSPDRSREPLFWDLRADLLAGRTTWREATKRLPLAELDRLMRTFDETTLRRIQDGVPAALAVLDKVPDVPPDPGDEMPGKEGEE